MQIATRFATIRASLGGSLHLIRGFANVLECSDIRLRDFQKSILDLITDINTPETFQAYLSLMFKDDAPVDLLLPRLVYLGGYSFRLQPSFSMDFPTENGIFERSCVVIIPFSFFSFQFHLSDESIKATCDPLILKYIKEIHDYHVYHNLKTSFTQSTYAIPLNYINFNPWHQLGFTVTAWFHFKPQPQMGGQQRSSDVSNDGDNLSRRKCEEHYLNNMVCVRSVVFNHYINGLHINF